MAVHFKQNDFLLQSTTAKPYLVHLGQKFIFFQIGTKGFRWPPKSPNWSKTFQLTILVSLGPVWVTLERWQACQVWPFLVQNRPFLGHPQSCTVDPKVKKRLITRSPIYGLLVEAHNTPFEHKCGRNPWKMSRNRSKFHEQLTILCHYLATPLTLTSK